MKLRLVGLLVLSVAPLIACVMLYGHRVWTAQWNEVPVALGWSASRPIWLLHPRWGEQYPSARASAAERRAWGEHNRSASHKQLNPHGLSLVLRDGLAPHDDHPLDLVLCSGLSMDALELFVRNPSESFFNEHVETILSESPHDPLVRADWLANYWGRRGDRSLNKLRAAERAVASQSRQTSLGDWNGTASDNRWNLLVEAGIVLLSSVPDVCGHDVNFGNVAGVPELRIWRPIELKSLDATTWETYAAAIEELLRAEPGDLELPFEQRAAQAWQELGLDSREATFAGMSDQGTSSRIVGWHCSLHLEVLETLAVEAFLQGQFNAAADWIELGAKVASQMTESVRSPWIHNYVLTKRQDFAGIAQTVRQSEDCPPDVAARMVAVEQRGLRLATPRTLAAPSGYLLPSICLDNLSRAFLSICVVTWAAAGLGWMCLSLRRNEPAGGTESDRAYGRSLFVAVLAIVLVVAAFGLLEACNYLGEGSASVGYGIAGIIFTVMMLMSAWWLVARELAHRGDPNGLAFRRRMFGLAGCAVIVVACRLLLGIGASQGRISFSFEQFERWAFDPTHQRLPAFLRVAFALAVPALLVTYAVLRSKRWTREPGRRPLFHPVVVALAGLVLGNWLLFGPFGEWVQRGRFPAPRHPTEWTPTAVAADSVGNILNDHFYWSRGKQPTPGSEFGRGWNLLTSTLAVRVTNLGPWLELACAAVWAFESWRRDRVKRLKERKEARSNDNGSPIGRFWLAGVLRSCVWLGLVALALHTWCTLGLGYCVSQVIARA